MALLSSDDKYRKFKYKIDEIYIMFEGGSSQKLPSERVSKISITHDYEGNLFPIFQMSLVLESSLYYKILKNKNIVKFKIRIQKYYRLIGREDRSLMKDYINGIYDLILDDDDYDKMESFRKEAKNTDYENVNPSDENDLFWVDNEIDFFLFRSDIIKNAKTQINTILKNATVTDAISYIATKADLNNLLMSPPDNVISYENLIIPQMEATKSIQFIDSYYGLYKTGSIIYFDFDIIFIISYDGKCTAYRRGESHDTTIIIPEKSSRYSSDPCSVKKKNDTTNYIICNSNDINIRNDSISFDAYASNDAKFVDVSTGEISETNSTAVTKGSKSSIRIFDDVTENKWINKIYAKQTESKSVVVEMNLSDYDIAMISPNKRVKFLFEDTKLTMKYRGNYQLSYIKHDFIKEGVDFTVSSSAMFRKL